MTASRDIITAEAALIVGDTLTATLHAWRALEATDDPIIQQRARIVIHTDAFNDGSYNVIIPSELLNDPDTESVSRAIADHLRAGNHIYCEVCTCILGLDMDAIAVSKINDDIVLHCEDCPPIGHNPAAAWKLWVYRRPHR